MMDMDTIIFEIKPEDAYGRIRIETRTPAYQKYNTTASSKRHIFDKMNHIADQMNNAEGMGVAFTVEGM